MRQHCRQLEALLARPDAGARTLGRAQALTALGVLVHPLGDSTRALSLHEEALAIFREHGDKAGAAWVLISMHHPLSVLGDRKRSLAATEESLALSREVGDRWGVARAHGVLGVLAIERGEWERAVSLLEEGRKLATEQGDRWIVALAIHNLTWVITQSPTDGSVDVEEASALMEEGLRLTRELGEQRTLPGDLLNVGAMRRRQGDDAAAAAFFEEALEVARKTGNKEMTAGALGALGELAHLQGDQPRAIHLLRESLALTLELDHRYGTGYIVEAIAMLAGTSGQPGRAAGLLGASDRLLEAIGVPRTDYERTEYESTVDVIRTALGAPAFADAWETGRTMPLAEVIVEAAAIEAAIRVVPAQGGMSQVERSAPALHGLSRRELEVLGLMAGGRSNQQIADDLFISARTVTTHVTHILGKLDVDSRTGAVAHAIRAGLA